MYRVYAEGKTLKELKKAVKDLHEELNEGILEKAPKATITKEVKEEVYDDIAPSSTFEMSDPRANTITEEAEYAEVAADKKSSELNFNDLDAAGFPWDARIHASSRAKVATGNWRIKRGVEDEEVAKIQASYSGNASFTPIVPTVTSAPTVVQPIKEITSPINVAPPLPTMNSGHTVATFTQNFPLILGGLITEGKVTQDYINQLKAYFKVDQIWMLNDAQRAEVFGSFVQYGLITQVG